MAVPYREFAIWTLHDLAIKEKTADRIVFDGNYVSEQHAVPMSQAGEAPEHFAARMRRFWKALPRHSDLSERLARAFEALQHVEEKKAAAYDILTILRGAPADERALHETRGIGHAYKPINSAFGTTRRGRRTKRKKRGLGVDYRQAESIRVQASKFIRHHTNFEALFRLRLELFKFMFWRDREWYEATEKAYLAQVAAFEGLIGTFEWSAAMILTAVAYLYHEQRRFAPATVYYRKAIRAARRAVMHEDFRQFVIHWMRLGIKLCLREAKVVEAPPYDGPWLPNSSQTIEAR